MLMMSMMFVSMGLSVVIYGLTFLLSKKKKKSKEMLSPYECGFSPIKNSRTPFSLRFFLLIILFLIFDVELAIIMPIILAKHMTWSLEIMPVSMSLVLILVGGLVHEWFQSSLEWVS